MTLLSFCSCYEPTTTFHWTAQIEEHALSHIITHSSSSSVLPIRFRPPESCEPKAVQFRFDSRQLSIAWALPIFCCLETETLLRAEVVWLVFCFRCVMCILNLYIHVVSICFDLITIRRRRRCVFVVWPGMNEDIVFEYSAFTEWVKEREPNNIKRIYL